MKQTITKLYQTRRETNGDGRVGNCLITCIACIMGLNNPEEAFQVQEHFEDKNWATMLTQWLLDNGYEPETLDGHLYDDTYYFVNGISERGKPHCVIYKNGELEWDVFEDGNGVKEINHYWRIIKTK